LIQDSDASLLTRSKFRRHSAESGWHLGGTYWVELGELKEDEVLQGIDGLVTVGRIEFLNASQPVYNLEILGEHVYCVGHSGVLCHNTGPGQSCTFTMKPQDPGSGICNRGGRLAQEQGREFRIDQLELNQFDLNQPKHVRGWLENERRRIASGNGSTSPRNPPGYVLGHGRSTPARDGFDYSNSRLQLQELNKLEESVRRSVGAP
jgi:hypothetical protein